MAGRVERRIYDVNEFFEATWKASTGNDIVEKLDEHAYFVRLRAIMADGYNVSIQAAYGDYCEPRLTKTSGYTQVELGYPSDEDELINSYAEDPDDYTATVYGYVPVEVVNELIKKHGGIRYAGYTFLEPSQII